MFAAVFLVEILENSVWIWEDIVKNRLISAISVACAGCLIFSFCYSNKQMQSQGLTAGIVASAAVNVEEALFFMDIPPDFGKTGMHKTKSLLKCNFL